MAGQKPRGVRGACADGGTCSHGCGLKNGKGDPCWRARHGFGRLGGGRPSKETHWIRMSGHTACGKNNTRTVRTVTDPDAVTCGQCRYTHAWAVASGCDPKDRG